MIFREKEMTAVEGREFPLPPTDRDSLVQNGSISYICPRGSLKWVLVNSAYCLYLTKNIVDKSNSSTGKAEIDAQI